MEAKQTTVFQCSKCYQYYLQKDIADSCCTKEAIKPAVPPKLCEICKEPLRYTGYTKCEVCKEKERFEKAEKLDSFDGWIYAEGYGCGEGYFQSIDELIELCEDDGIALPEYVYTTIETKWGGIDLDRALENELEEYYDDARDAVVDEQELYEFMNRWNIKQTIVSYYPNTKQVVLLKNYTKVS